MSICISIQCSYTFLHRFISIHVRTHVYKHACRHVYIDTCTCMCIELHFRHHRHSWDQSNGPGDVKKTSFAASIPTSTPEKSPSWTDGLGRTLGPVVRAAAEARMDSFTEERPTFQSNSPSFFLDSDALLPKKSALGKSVSGFVNFMLPSSMPSSKKKVAGCDDSASPCNGNGICRHNLCTCDPGWTRADCSSRICSKGAHECEDQGGSCIFAQQDDLEGYCSIDE